MKFEDGLMFKLRHYKFHVIQSMHYVKHNTSYTAQSSTQHLLHSTQ
jgi:hypothetical protein